MNNFVKLEGNLGKDPEIRSTQSGTKVATFSLTVRRSKKGEENPITDWFNIVAWGEQATQVEEHLKKGTMVQINGKLQTRNYDDKDGKKVYVTEVWLDNFWLAPKKAEKKEEKQEFDNGSMFSDAELPF